MLCLFLVFDPFVTNKLFTMKHCILQLEALAQVPEIVSLRHDDYILWVSEYFFNWSVSESRTFPNKTVGACLETAEKKGLVRKYSGYPFPGYSASHVGYGNFAIFYDRNSVTSAYKKELKEKYPHDEVLVVFATPDRTGDIAAKALYEEMVTNGAQRDAEVEVLAAEVKSERWILSISLLILFTVVYFIPAAFINFLSYVKTSKIFSAILVFFVLFLLWSLYKLRRTRRVQYGIIELFVGLLTISKSLISFFTLSVAFSAIDYLTVLSGMYIVIRGLDNIETGLKAKNMTYYLRKWERIF